MLEDIHLRGMGREDRWKGDGKKRREEGGEHQPHP